MKYEVAKKLLPQQKPNENRTRNPRPNPKPQHLWATVYVGLFGA